MWKSFIAILCALGTVTAYYEPQTILVPEQAPRNRTRISSQDRGLRRMSCPEGFVRLKRNCFYFSESTANWLEAHFQCKDRNSTLATLTKKHMDRRLRDALTGPQLKVQEERWIGARYNWEAMRWEWGATGEKITYDGFGKLKPGGPEVYRWHCAAIDPKRKYRWVARSCVEIKYYVCQVAATGPSGKKRNRQAGTTKVRVKSQRRKNDIVNQNQIDANAIVPYHIQPLRTNKRPRQTWGTDVRKGQRSPSTRWAPGTKYSDRLHRVKGTGAAEPDQWVTASRAALMSQKGTVDSKTKNSLSGESFPGAGTDTKSLAAGSSRNAFSQPNDHLLNFFTEEILLKN